MEIKATALDSTGAYISDVQYYPDAAGRTVQQFTRTLNSSGSLYSFQGWQYDSRGNLVQHEFPCLTADCPTQPSTIYQYDGLNRLTQVQLPNSTTPTTYAYVGDATMVTDPNGHAKTLVHDANGWLRRTEDATGYTIILGYDAAGSHIGTTDSLNNTLWSGTVQYGIAPFTTVAADADLGTWHYTPDALGEITAWSDAKGQSFSAKYDALSRMTDRYEPDLYSHWTWGTSALAREIGRLHSVCTGTGANPTACTAATGYAESESYDSDGRQSQRSIAIPGDTTYTYTWTYSATTGLLDTLTYPAGPSGIRPQVKYGYANGWLQSITDTSDSPNVTLWTGNSTDADGNYIQETLGNGVVVDHAYDPITGMQKVTAGPSGTATLQNNSYLYDPVGNLEQRQDNNAGTTENVTYDSVDRLRTTVGDTNTNLTYDPMGRLATWEASGASTNVKDYTTPQAGCIYYANAQPHAVRSNRQGTFAPTSYCYDANGNMTTVSSAGTVNGSYSWTSFNQPNTLGAPTLNSSSQFFYNQNHQRYKQVASYSGSAETTEYIGGLMEKATNSNGTTYRYYIPAGSNLVLYNRWTNSFNAIYYITKDNIDSTAVITDHTGALVLAEKFAALGWNESPGSGAANIITSVTRHEFTGQEGLDNSGLWMVNMNGRIYLPSGSMFLSADPNIPDPTRTVDYNRYAYVDFNPMTYTDPTGYDCDAKCEKDKNDLTNSSSGGSGSGGTGGSSGPGDGFGPGGNFGEGPDGGMYARFSQASCSGDCWVSVDDWNHETITQGDSSASGWFYYGKVWYQVSSSGGGLQSGTVFGMEGQSFGSAFGGPNFWGIGGVAGGLKPGASGQQTNLTITKQQCMASAAHPVSGRAAFKLGAFGQFHVTVAGISVDLDLNLWTYNIATGGNYETQGASLGVTLFGRPLGFGAERSKPSGTYGWGPWEGYGNSDPVQGSGNDGLSLDFEGGLLLGGELSVSHLETAIGCSIPAAQ